MLGEVKNTLEDVQSVFYFEDDLDILDEDESDEDYDYDDETEL